MNRIIRFPLVLVLLYALIVGSCSAKPVNIVSATVSISSTPTTVQIEIQQTETPTQNTTPAATSTPLSIRETWLQNHENERIQYLREQGPAKTIPALEYHGDDYNFQFGPNSLCELAPEAFSEQMRWFHDNKVHAVTGEELVKWLNGEIELPKQSVLLTFDLAGSDKAVTVPRMVAVFEKYGMHGIFAIQLWSSETGKGQTWCENDKCWQNYRDAYNSGTVTIANHSIDHPDFALLSETAGLNNLDASKSILEEHIGDGLSVDVMAWPFESVPTWANSVKTIGYAVSFGGSTYKISENAVYQNRAGDRYDLPRLLPPNSDGFSMRPYGKTMKEMMEMYWNLGN